MQYYYNINIIARYKARRREKKKVFFIVFWCDNYAINNPFAKQLTLNIFYCSKRQKDKTQVEHKTTGQW